MDKFIEVKGARSNNLKNVSIRIPKNKITIFTGLSGSGKSSLVFDTIAAESQRLLNETYSSFIQRMLPTYEVPKVDQISNLPVSIIVDQKKIGGNIRSTVGTATEIYTGLRLLYSRLAKPFIGYSMIYSFNNPDGMCEVCQGIGEVNHIKIDKLIDFDKSLNDGAINFPTFQPGGFRWLRYTESGNFDNDKKIEDYTPEELKLLLYDKGSKPLNPTDKWPKTALYVGVIERIQKSIIEKAKNKYTDKLKSVMDIDICPECLGTRVNKRIRSAMIDNKSIADCVEMPIDELIDFLNHIKRNASTSLILKNILNRLQSLNMVGLNYLTLSRSTNSLSGGESQRIKMTKHLNSALSDVLYIFDEPSVGLHPEDLIGINKIFKMLRDKGNTVLLVDHDPDIIKIADNVVEMGESSGKNGGRITFSGTYQELLKSNTITGKSLSEKHQINTQRKNFKKYYQLSDVSLFNVKYASVKIPKNAMTVVTGVAGSGKSTLIRRLFVGKYPDSIVFDQSQIKGSSRSNILTYLGVFDDIRKLFAKKSHENVSLFSFNGQGACPECHGKGYIKFDLAYMGDVKQKCELCKGKQYNSEALEIRLNGRSIYDVLQLTASEALDLFDGVIAKKIQFLIDAKLDYLNLGQRLDTLSGGELQRLKIAKSLLNSMDNDVLILDEPSTGLHEADIANLLELFNKLLLANKTLIILEHNLKIISQADWIIDMGPHGGRYGGNIVFSGYVTDLLNCYDSYTAKHLRKFIKV
ncbi:excinuclease ABC subunit UvrA [Companilactobacillus allii]|uniref:UvrABC system protein A n=1 Tax=Companilactobacillus allii TaxID=1847728 RepID=A0A1P8Q561_9LACO|nr:excinuclease ABC subunit UvrA [Companilactobacillus allii]APX73004.1 daunorubicin resistance protein DrrC [Companilactobacillus allii]USQ67801.1 excinuclease ABC subunit UvrA [Companilactobacillus allii]